MKSTNFKCLDVVAIIKKIKNNQKQHTSHVVFYLQKRKLLVEIANKEMRKKKEEHLCM